ncbi:MAG: C_GCAxxG_C_C family protein [Planctomycetes bacterium]|nr:C_GCAxxG_C_C family protein [Planctomycetota bacterium]
MSQKSDMALGLFKDGQFCSQAVLSAFCDDLELPAATALKIASGFGGGIGRMGDVCGAVTGAILALGLHDWQGETVSKDEKMKITGRVRKFTARFKQKHGSITCRDLLGCDIGQADGFQTATDTGVFVSVCQPLVQDAVCILEALFDES